MAYNIPYKSITTSRISKLKTYIPMLKPTILYRCETLSMTGKDKVMLNVCKRKKFSRRYMGQ